MTTARLTSPSSRPTLERALSALAPPLALFLAAALVVGALAILGA